MVKLFVEQGVPTKGTHFFPFNNSSQQIPPLLFAIQYNNAAAIGILIANGADAFATATWGYPTANFAAYYGYVESLRALGEAGVDLQRDIPAGRPYAGETMLMHAAQGGKMAAIDYLQANGGKIGHADSRGNTAVDHAMRYGHTTLALQLRMKQLIE
jgi:ankyrin repeat protein